MARRDDEFIKRLDAAKRRFEIMSAELKRILKRMNEVADDPLLTDEEIMLLIDHYEARMDVIDEEAERSLQ